MCQRVRFNFQTAKRTRATRIRPVRPGTQVSAHSSFRVPAARDARVMHRTCPSEERGRREDRAPAGAHGPRAEKSTRQNHRLSRGYRPSLRNGLRLIRDLPGDHAWLPPSPREIAPGRLSACIGAPGPHDFAVRDKRHSSHDASRPSHPASRIVTTAKRPSHRGGTRK
jgi:hypothetical protein